MIYTCNICNKDFKTLSGQWKHNNKYHDNNDHNLPQNTTIITQKTTILHNNLQCKCCNKILSRYFIKNF
jgi:hypothetical protein